MFVTVHKNARLPSLLVSLRAFVKEIVTPKAEKLWQTVFPLKTSADRFSTALWPHLLSAHVGRTRLEDSRPSTPLPTHLLGGELPLNLAGVCYGFLFQHPALLQVLPGKGRHAEPLILLHMCQLMRP